MRIFDSARLRLLGIAQGVMQRTPDVTIQKDGSVYVERWHCFKRNPFGNVYIHRFLRPDADGALHDHRYANVSVILENDYVEELFYRWPHPRFDAGGTRITRRVYRSQGELIFRLPWTAHRVEPEHDGAGNVLPVITMFITGPHIRNWGFHCPKGWVPWEKFVGNPNTQYQGEQSGEGCP